MSASEASTAPRRARLPLALIRVDGEVQSRAETDQLTVDHYAEAMRAGVDFDPVTVFQDGEVHWLADGFHRAAAAKQAGLSDLAAHVHMGTKRDAILYSVGANALHGRQRTNADKRHAVDILLRDTEWGAWSDREIARRAAVSVDLVNRMRGELSVCDGQITRLVARNGTTYAQRWNRAAKIAPTARAAILASPIADNPIEVARLATKPPETQERVGELIASGEASTVAEAIRAIRRSEAIDLAEDYDPDPTIEVRHGDCLDVIRALPERGVSLLLTDPPYATTDHEWDRFASDAEYLTFMRAWMLAMRPKMGVESTAFVFCDASRAVDVALLLRETGWPLVHQAIWHRPNLAKKRSGSNTFLSSYEVFWHCGTRPLFFPEEWAGERFDVQTFAAPQSNHTEDPARHPAQKPLALFRRLIEIGSRPGDLVVDPFCGSGTTAVAAKLERRRCVASDASDECTRITLGRLAGI